MEIIYFASLKERLNTGSETIDIEVHNINTVSDLYSYLRNKYGNESFPDNIICAVNHEVAIPSLPINNTEEIAFYPPVTGG